MPMQNGHPGKRLVFYGGPLASDRAKMTANRDIPTYAETETEAHAEQLASKTNGDGAHTAIVGTQDF